MLIKNKNNDVVQLVIFQLRNEIFGVDIKDVDEIIKVTNLTRIPRAPSYLIGVTNLRGSIFPVIDIHQRFGLGHCEITESSRILVVNIDGSKSGLVIDNINEVVRLKEELIESATSISKNVKEEFINNVIKIKEREHVVMVLKLSSICKMNIEDDLDIAIAKEKEKILSTRTSEVQLVSFLIGNEEYSIKIKGVKEIIRLSDIVRVPNSPDYVRGLISHRDTLLPVIDLRLKFNQKGLDLKEYSSDARIIVVDLQNITFGLLVDKVNGIVRVFKNLIEPPPHIITTIDTNQLHGIVKLNNGNRLIMLLNLENTISIDEIKRVQNADENKKHKVERGVFKSIELFESLIAFKLGKEEFAINIDIVHEINRIQDITRLPNSINFMEGVINLRGEVIPVFSLRKRFGLKDDSNKNRQKLIIIHISDKKAGLLVDSVSEVFHIEKKDIESLPDAIKSSVAMEFMSGIIRLHEAKRMLILLNLEMVLSEEEKKQFFEFEKNNTLFTKKIDKSENIRIETEIKKDPLRKESHYISEFKKTEKNIRKKEEQDKKISIEQNPSISNEFEVSGQNLPEIKKSSLKRAR